MEMVSSVPVAQQAVMIMMMSLFSRSSVCFSVCLRVHLNAPKINKISWGSMPPDPPTVNDCRAAMFSTSANEIAPPQMVKVMYGPGFKRWLDLNFSYYTVVEYINSSFKCVGERSSFCLHAGKKSVVSILEDKLHA